MLGVVRRGGWWVESNNVFTSSFEESATQDHILVIRKAQRAYVSQNMILRSPASDESRGTDELQKLVMLAKWLSPLSLTPHVLGSNPMDSQADRYEQLSYSNFFFLSDFDHSSWLSSRGSLRIIFWDT